MTTYKDLVYLTADLIKEHQDVRNELRYLYSLPDRSRSAIDDQFEKQVDIENRLAHNALNIIEHQEDVFGRFGASTVREEQVQALGFLIGQLLDS